MTSISSNEEDRTEHVNNSVSPGMYFAFKEDYKIEDVGPMQIRDGHPEWADKGTVLMVSDVDYIDEKPHTILLKPHPDWMAYYRNYKKQVIRMLVADFARYMEFSENAEQIRDKERGNAEQRIKDIQETMRAYRKTRLKCRIAT